VTAARCSWAEGQELAAYHDEEWGRPITDERGLFERLSLEAFQSGLSWVTILRKRDGFRQAFRDFDPESVAAFGPRDVERLLGDARIVRNRAKIEATIANARATVAVRNEEGLASLVWSFASVPGRAAPESLGELPAVTPESTTLAKTLRARGFRFVGPTTAYALMQACGLVNDHVATCFVRAEVEREQERARRSIRAG
jgi:DNA-3-methyladenine glycosylase I